MIEAKTDVLRRIAKHARSDEGQGLVELLIALTMLTLAVGALISVLTAGAVALQRSDQKGTALTLADKQTEVYRTFIYSNIRLNGGSIPASGTYHTYGVSINASTACGSGTYTTCLVAGGVNSEAACTTITRNGTTTNGSKNVTGLSQTSDLTAGMFLSGTGIAAPGTTIASITGSSTITLSAPATASGTASLTFMPVACAPSQTVRGPDGRTYEVDTYITYYSPPSGVSHGTKQVLVLVRDPTRAGVPILAQDATVFQPLTVATT